jgi:hypothetical protein
LLRPLTGYPWCDKGVWRPRWRYGCPAALPGTCHRCFLGAQLCSRSLENIRRLDRLTHDGVNPTKGASSGNIHPIMYTIQGKPM